MDEETKGIMRKTFIPRELKIDIDGEGTFQAVFATMNVIDKDGDVTVNGAFGEQQVKISQYNHGSWNQGAAALPVGVGKIYEQGDDAIVSGEFDMDDPDAVKHYKKLKYMQAKGHTQEWSYALPEIDYEYRDEGGKRVRVLKRIFVPEVSPVLMGAGENTRLLSIKSQKQEEEEEPKSRTFAEQAAETLEATRSLVKRYQDIETLRKAAGKNVSSQSTDMLLKVRDKLQEIITALDVIAGKASTVDSDYLMLKNISKKFQEE